MSHGDPPPIEADDLIAIVLSRDPALANVVADMHTWSEAHPCECEARCSCDEVEAG